MCINVIRIPEWCFGFRIWKDRNRTVCVLFHALWNSIHTMLFYFGSLCNRLSLQNLALAITIFNRIHTLRSGVCALRMCHISHQIKLHHINWIGNGNGIRMEEEPTTTRILRKQKNEIKFVMKGTIIVRFYCESVYLC